MLHYYEILHLPIINQWLSKQLHLRFAECNISLTQWRLQYNHLKSTTVWLSKLSDVIDRNTSRHHINKWPRYLTKMTRGLYLKYVPKFKFDNKRPYLPHQNENWLNDESWCISAVWDSIAKYYAYQNISTLLIRHLKKVISFSMKEMGLLHYQDIVIIDNNSHCGDKTTFRLSYVHNGIITMIGRHLYIEMDSIKPVLKRLSHRHMANWKWSHAVLTHTCLAGLWNWKNINKNPLPLCKKIKCDNHNNA